MTPAYPKPAPRRKKAPAVPSRTVRSDVIARDGSYCQWCGRYAQPVPGFYSLQHRRARGAGGTNRLDANGMANLVFVCGTATTGCHEFIESHPAEAAARGFRISQGESPSEIPIRCRNPISGLSWHLLDDDGNKPFMTIADAESVLRARGILGSDDV